jgi:hypothetical protein
MGWVCIDISRCSKHIRAKPTLTFFFLLRCNTSEEYNEEICTDSLD